jgi:CubicO group peptidase (beta-lactamase class C family)
MALRNLANAALRRPAPVVLEGNVHPAYARVAECLRAQIAGYGGGGAVCVYHHGECVVDVWGGVTNRARAPWRADTMAPSFSTTKGVAATLLHVLVDRGLLDYDDRVADYWPEFAQGGKDRITVRHVLAHQSGLYHIRQMIDHADRMLDWQHMIAAIEKAQPIHPPGERTGYHGLTFGFIVGEILQRVTGVPFSELVRRELAEPLRADGLFIGAPAGELGRAAQLMWPRFALIKLVETEERIGSLLAQAAGRLAPLARMAGVGLDFQSFLDALAPRGISSFDFGGDESLRVAIPSGNGLFTARSLARMYAMLAGGGEMDGVRVLSQDTVQRASTPQNFAGPRSVMPFDMRWRLGYHGIPTTRGFLSRAFGHFGFGGSGAWAEPNRRLAVALIVNTGMGTPFGDLRIVRISSAALACADARSPKPVAVAAARKPASGRRVRATVASSARKAAAPLTPAARRKRKAASRAGKVVAPSEPGAAVDRDAV